LTYQLTDRAVSIEQSSKVSRQGRLEGALDGSFAVEIRSEEMSGKTPYGL